MSIHKLAGSAALIALMAGLPALSGMGAALAQEAAPATQPATQPDASGTPALLTQLGVTDLSSDSWRDGGREYEGRLPDGTEIEAKFTRDGTLAEFKAEDGALPAPVVEQLLPQAVRDSEIFGQFDLLERIDTREGMFELRGRDEAGAKMRARMDDAGTVMRFGRESGDDDRRGAGKRGEGKRAEMRGHRDGYRDGPRGDHARGPDESGPREGGPRAGGPREGGPREGGPREGGPQRGEMRRMPPAPDFDTVEMNQRLTAAGYRDFGFLVLAGPRLLLDATNPDGEAVRLELDRQGEVVRETAR